MMMFGATQDYHIHTYLSKCSSDPEQTTERILKYAIDNGITELAVTNHFWDSAVPGASAWLTGQDLPHISRDLPLPVYPGIRFHFGCEADIDKFGTFGISRPAYDRFDFINISVTHLHMIGFTIDPADCTREKRAELYISRFHRALSLDLPFKRVGFAHPTTPLLANGDWEEHLRVLDAITDDDYAAVFSGVAARGAGIELNMPVFRYSEEELPRVLRPYRIAKACGCLFYTGSDAHHPDALDSAPDRFRRMAELLNLTENDRFLLPEGR